MASLPIPPTLAESIRLADVAGLSAAAGEDAAHLAARLAARDHLHTLELPSRARHLWRYTDPALFVPQHDPTLAAPAAVAPPWRPAEELAGFAQVSGGALRQVELSAEALTAGVEILDLHRADAALLGGAVPATHGFVEAINAAAWRGGVLVRVPAGVRLERPLRVRFAAPEGGLAVTRLLVVAGADSAFELVEGHGAGGDGGQVLAVTELLLDEGAEVRHGLVQRWHEDVAGHVTAYARLGARARFQMALASFGGALYKADVGAVLAGDGADSEIFGVAMGGGRQHMDHHTEHIHTASRTHSNLDVKVALTEAARSAYTGIIRIAADAAGCEAYQENRNLLLSPDARAESIPELEILNEDVRCTHGATVAPLEEEQLFYLGSRGLARSHATRLIVYGFLDQTLSRLPVSTRERIEAMVAARLHAE